MSAMGQTRTCDRALWKSAFRGESRHRLVNKVCKRSCKRTARYSLTRSITSQHRQKKNSEQQHTLG
jgi:hypothetical protein